MQQPTRRSRPDPLHLLRLAVTLNLDGRDLQLAQTLIQGRRPSWYVEKTFLSFGKDLCITWKRPVYCLEETFCAQIET